MLTNTGSDRVRSVRALSRRAVREREALFVVEGPQAVREVVAHRADTVRDLYFEAQDSRSQAGVRQGAVLDSARAAGLSIVEVSHEVLVAMSDTMVPQGVVAVCRPLDMDLDVVLRGAPRLLVILTNVRDPGNAGTVIRGADAAGADAVLLSDSSVDIYNPKVVRSTVGSLFHLPIVTGVPVATLLERVRAAGLALLAADGSGDRILGDVADNLDGDLLAGPHAWVMGNEAWGLEGHVRAACDAVVRVPIYGKAESLNLAMAATICLFHSASVQKRSRIR
ncbi:MAG TPA: RNA methyltransferase [Dermatophilaceae bacterium]